MFRHMFRQHVPQDAQIRQAIEGSVKMFRQTCSVTCPVEMFRHNKFDSLRDARRPGIG